jgi:transcriptional regulator with XRE-family HTH domain
MGGKRMSAVAKRLESIKAHGGVSGREVAQLLETTPETVSRWQQGRNSPQPNSLDRLLRLDWLAEQLGAFYEPDEVRLWLFSPHAELGGARPADLIASGRIDAVLAVVDRLQSGAYV